MPYHRIRTLTTATAATANNAICGVWNPGTRAVIVKEFAFCATTAPGAGAGYIIRRTTARGTATAFAPVIQNHDQRLMAPLTAFAVDNNYTVQPTLDTAGEMDAWMMATVAGAGIVRSLGDGIWVPPGAGLAWVNRAGVIFPVSEFVVVVDEA